MTVCVRVTSVCVCLRATVPPCAGAGDKCPSAVVHACVMASRIRGRVLGVSRVPCPRWLVLCGCCACALRVLGLLRVFCVCWRTRSGCHACVPLPRAAAAVSHGLCTRVHSAGVTGVVGVSRVSHEGCGCCTCVCVFLGRRGGRGRVAHTCVPCACHVCHRRVCTLRLLRVVHVTCYTVCATGHVLHEHITREVLRVTVTGCVLRVTRTRYVVPVTHRVLRVACQRCRARVSNTPTCCMLHVTRPYVTR